MDRYNIGVGFERYIIEEIQKKTKCNLIDNDKLILAQQKLIPDFNKKIIDNWLDKYIIENNIDSKHSLKLINERHKKESDKKYDIEICKMGIIQDYSLSIKLNNPNYGSERISIKNPNFLEKIIGHKISNYNSNRVLKILEDSKTNRKLLEPILSIFEEEINGHNIYNNYLVKHYFKFPFIEIFYTKNKLYITYINSKFIENKILHAKISKKPNTLLIKIDNDLLISFRIRGKGSDKIGSFGMEAKIEYHQFPTKIY